MRKLIFLFITCFSSSVFAQQDSSVVKSLSVSGFADLYYTYDFRDPASQRLPGFLYSHASHNKFSLNNALVSLHYEKERVKATIGLHTGTYVQENYASEPQLFQNIYEANASYEVLKNVWFTAGIFSSHMGFESALSKDNWTLTRSMAAENSPYFETGAKLTFSKSEKFTASALVLNGWQRIRENNSNKALGTQLQYKPHAKLLLNSSTFFGNEMPDSAFSTRFFHDFYLTWAIHPRLDLMGLYDIGFQENKTDNSIDSWDAGGFMIRYKPFEKFYTAARAEFYQDPEGVILSSYQPYFNRGFSLNLDYKPQEQILFRVEGKMLSGNQDYYQGKKANSNQTFVLTVSTAVSL